MKKPNEQRLSSIVRELLIELGEDPDREGLLKTPNRVARAMIDLTKGYHQTPKEVLNDAVFTSSSNSMVIVRDIEVYSLCEHHMLPFYGRCHVGYIAAGKVVGLSKIARIVDCFAKRLQIQERLTEEIAHAIEEITGAEGVGVVMNCAHLCMMMRGVEKQNATTVTSSVLGSFREHPEVRAEFMSLVK
ncbi:MAG: GTP cyclohydrolase I FolE [Kiritimatiellia bacterium]